MNILVVVAYVVVVLFVVLAMTRLLSVAFEMFRPARRWNQRSGRDRRRRPNSVSLDRRCGPRRQDDIAAEFLAEADARPAVVMGGSAGGQEA